MTELLELYTTSLIFSVILVGKTKKTKKQNQNKTMKIDMIVSFDNGLYLKDGRSL